MSSATEIAARRAVKRIVRDLSDRRGLGDEWGSLYDDVREEIVNEWTAIVEEEIRPLTRQATAVLPDKEKLT